MSLIKCPKCQSRFTDTKALARSDAGGSGQFCNALWKDSDGPFCATKAAEGHGCHCSFTEADVWLDCCKLRCSHGHKELVGECQDFEPSAKLREKFGLVVPLAEQACEVMITYREAAESAKETR